jgi:hypothetical protein
VTRARKSLLVAVAGTALAVAPGSPAQAAGPSASASASKPKTVTVCRRGCAFSSIQKAVNRVRKGGTVRIRPGTYVQGVTVPKSKDGITITGTAPARRVVLQGKGARDRDGNPTQNGVFVDGADRVTMRNLTAKNFPANGFFVRNCAGYTMRGLVAAFNRSYGLYAFNCTGGRMTRSTGYGHGDSAFYVGQTPVQTQPRRTRLDHLTAYENVLGYSGTNSKYVDITDSEFFNNGAGVVPNTLSSEKFAPAEQGTITRNQIYWNNFNYFRADSPVKPLESATGDFNYPTGVGVVLFGTTGWKVSGNDIFGNFKFGLLSVSDPTYAPALTVDNDVTGNRMGAANGDLNAVDFFSEGSGRGNCYSDNGADATFDLGSAPAAQLYPACATPRPANGIDQDQLSELAQYLLQGETQEDSWVKHPHKEIPGREPIDGQTAG